MRQLLVKGCAGKTKIQVKRCAVAHPPPSSGGLPVQRSPSPSGFQRGMPTPTVAGLHMKTDQGVQRRAVWLLLIKGCVGTKKNAQRFTFPLKRCAVSLKTLFPQAACRCREVRRPPALHAECRPRTPAHLRSSNDPSTLK